MRCGKGLVVVLFAATACAHAPNNRSWVDGVKRVDADALVEDIVEMVSEELPAAKTILVMQPAEQSNAVTVPLEKALRQAGYAMALPGAAPRGGMTFQYRITADGEDAFIVRLTLGERQVARSYKREGKKLVAASPVAVGRRR